MDNHTKQGGIELNFFKSAIIGLIIVLFLGLIALPVVVTVIQYKNEEVYEGVVTDKYNKRSGDSDKFYVVLDDDKVIQNKDLLFKKKFNSADIQASIKKGDKIKVKTIGYRVHFFDMYPILYDISRDNSFQ